MMKFIANISSILGIIFAGSLEGNLIISSKHSLGGSGGGGGGGAKPSHAHKGREWLNKHLQQAGKTEEKLVEFLESHRVTAVFEVNAGRMKKWRESAQGPPHHFFF